MGTKTNKTDHEVNKLINKNITNSRFFNNNKVRVTGS